MPKVVFATPSLQGPKGPYLEALEASLPLIEKHGWTHQYVQEIGNPYISNARAIMTRKALDVAPDCIVYLDYDLSWEPEDMLKLLQAEGDVVCGTYRFKKDEEEYMGDVAGNADGIPLARDLDGALIGIQMPAGFLKITTQGIAKFMKAYPHLCYGEPYRLHVDLFNHGAHNGIWYGEDYAFCRNWRECGGQIWVLPDLNLTHHGDKPYPGNYAEFLKRQPGGINAAAA
jgi:hypothetical protein